MSSFFGGGQDIKQESTFKPSPQQEEIIKLAMPYIKEFAKAPPGPPTGTSIAGFNPTQIAAQTGVLGAVPGMQSFANRAAEANRFLFSPDILNPNTNPGLKGAIDAATRPIIETATQQLLPNLRGEAASLGQYSGTKNAQAGQGIADATLRQVGDTAAKIASDTYGENLGAMVKGLALAPQTQQEQIQPFLAQAGVGDVRHALEQAQMSERWQQEQLAKNWPLIVGQEIMGSAGLIPGGTNVAQGNMPGASPFSQILGGLSMLPAITKGLGALGSLFAFL